MKKFSALADAISMCSFALPAMRSAVSKKRGKVEIATRGIISGFGGGFARDCVLASLTCGVSFAIFSSIACWTGVLCAMFILFALRSVNKEKLLNHTVVTRLLILIDGGGSARFLCQAEQKCIMHGITTEAVVIFLSFMTAIGGGFINTIIQRDGRRKNICRRIVPYSIWFFFAWMHYQLTSEGYDGMTLTNVFVLIGMLIAITETAFTEDEFPLVLRIMRGIDLSYRIGLNLSRGKQFELIKHPGKGRHVLQLILSVCGDTVTAVVTL